MSFLDRWSPWRLRARLAKTKRQLDSDRKHRAKYESTRSRIDSEYIAQLERAHDMSLSEQQEKALKIRELQRADVELRTESANAIKCATAERDQLAAQVAAFHELVKQREAPDA